MKVLRIPTSVGGGSVMLKPTRSAERPCLLVTIWAYPPRERWVRDVMAYNLDNENRVGQLGLCPRRACD